MPEKANTLTPEVMKALAAIPVLKSKTGDLLDDLVEGVENQTKIKEFIQTYFGSVDGFVVAVYSFLKTNNYLPDPEVEDEDDETIDPLDMLEARNWE